MTIWAQGRNDGEGHGEETAESVRDSASQLPNRPSPADSSPEGALPLSRRSIRRRGRRTQPHFNEDTLPRHVRAAYINPTPRNVNNIQPDGRAYMRASINAQAKLDQYCALLGDSPLFAAAVILHPGRGIQFLGGLGRSRPIAAERQGGPQGLLRPLVSRS
jgi:hypothetical protein